MCLFIIRYKFSLIIQDYHCIIVLCFIHSLFIHPKNDPHLKLFCKHLHCLYKFAMQALCLFCIVVFSIRIIIHEIFWKNDHNCLFFCCFLYILFCFFYIFSPVSGRCCLCNRYFIHEILSPFQSLEYHISGFFCSVINFL